MFQSTKLIVAFAFALAACGGSSQNSGADMSVTPPSCTSYCDIVLASCTGANVQYASTQACMDACKTFAVGSPNDYSGNTLFCRFNHAQETGSDPAQHCVHAGPTGGDMCITP